MTIRRTAHCYAAYYVKQSTTKVGALANMAETVVSPHGIVYRVLATNGQAKKSGIGTPDSAKVVGNLQEVFTRWVLTN